MKLYYYYDKDADILYFSQGKPSARDDSREIKDDVVLRIDPRTKKVRGFTVLNFSKRLSKDLPLSLPVEVEFSSAS